MTIDYSESFLGAKQCLKDFENHIDNNRLEDARKSCEQAIEHLSEIIGWIDEKQGVQKEDADGWIEWKGGECPVPDSTFVDTVLRDEYIVKNRQAVDCYWDHLLNESNIVRYRVAK